MGNSLIRNGGKERLQPGDATIEVFPSVRIVREAVSEDVGRQVVWVNIHALPFFPAGGGLTMSEKGGLDELQEFFRAVASSSARRLFSARRAEFRTCREINVAPGPLASAL